MNEILEHAAWVAGDVLVLSGRISDGEELSALLGEDALGVDTQVLALPSNGNDVDRRALVVGRFSVPLAGGGSPWTLTLGAGESARSVDAPRLADSLMDPFLMLCEVLAPLDPERRREALRFLWLAAAPNLERPGSFEVAQLLARVNHEMRPPFPRIVYTRDHPTAVHVDTIIRLGTHAVWARGWLHDPDSMVARLTLLAPEGGRAELASGLFRYRRSDAEEYFGRKHGVPGERHGFMGFAQLDGASLFSSDWLLELETVFGKAVELPLPDLVVDPVAARNALLVTLREERPGDDQLIRNHVHPAMAVIQDSMSEGAAIDTVVQLGNPPTSPSVSVIVPLYKELSFLEDQMSHWASDPQMAHEDLIYVLDSPEQAAELDKQAHGLYSLYGIPFRIAVMRGNAGFAGVNNCAVTLARTDRLLLLNSDVVPDTPGWLSRMSAFYDATPGIGALGPKLLFEDHSIQHAGMYFHRAASSELWENMHYFKGQHRDLPAANVARQVPAVTGACLMVDRQLYESVGGLSYRYAIGGYEDSDFCLKLTDEGHEHWYMPGAELYHLEDQSYPGELRKLTTRYNMWLQTELWDERIDHAMEQYRGLGASR